MEIRITEQGSKVVGHRCDVCHKACYKDDEELGDELATLAAEWGYWSDGKDLSWWECHMCEACAEKVKKFIEDLGGTVRSDSYRMAPHSWPRPFRREGVDYEMEVRRRRRRKAQRK